MQRGLALPLVFVLVLATVPIPTTGSTEDPLVVDAGSSQAVVPGQALVVASTVVAGPEPANLTWTYQASRDRFADPYAAATTFDTTGLAPDQIITLTLTATGPEGTIVQDTVNHTLAKPVVVLDVQGTVDHGLPDDDLAPGLIDGQTQVHGFEVPDGTLRLAASLDWVPSPNATTTDDLDLVLYDPEGEDATGNQGRTGDRPEHVTVARPTHGTWEAQIEPYTSDGTTYTVQATAWVAPDLPTVDKLGTFQFGHQDTQQLGVLVSGGQGTQASWDLDLDGTYEAPGLEPVADLAPGTHEVALKLTDDRGFEDRQTTTVKVSEDIEHLLPIACQRSPWRLAGTMERSHARGTCWLHHGHHTYFLGDASPLAEAYTLEGGDVRIVSVEQHYTPSTETDAANASTPIHVQVSMDARSWTDIQVLNYTLLSANVRQVITATLASHDEPFRYLRVHEPRSAAQGLSGFLDASRFELAVQPAQASPASGQEAGQRSLDCREADHMESFFDDHPCWFGGINRYDAPSFFHTYPLDGVASVDRIAGEVQVAPWRSDDWFLPLVPPVSQVTTTQVFVQASVDSYTWSTLHTFEVRFDLTEPTPFSLDLDQPVPARYLRFVTDHKPGSEDHREDPPSHHPEAFFLDSRLTVEGMLPVTSQE